MWSKIKYWFIIYFSFTDNENYLIKRSIDDRIDNLEKILVTEKWVDKQSIQTDINDLKKLRNKFKNTLWS